MFTAMRRHYRQTRTKWFSRGGSSRSAVSMGWTGTLVAVDLAKMSLWLVTLAKDHALTFVDHAAAARRLAW